MLTPIRFGAAGRELMGVLQTPPGTPLPQAILLCNPFGQEAIRCHRLYRALADRLVRQGYAVMRFDYYATGDAAGDDDEGDVDGWCQDILSAHAELRARTGCRQAAWFGLRLGATLAALAAGQANGQAWAGMNRLVLWNPVLDGRSCLAQWRQSHLDACHQSYGARLAIDPALVARCQKEAGEEVLGFVLSPVLRAQIEAIEPARVGDALAGVADVTMLCNADVAGLGSFKEHVRGRQAPVAIQLDDTRVDWSSNEAQESSIVPAAAMQSILGFLAIKT